MDSENLRIPEPSSPEEIFPRTPSQFSTRTFTQVNKHLLFNFIQGCFVLTHIFSPPPPLTIFSPKARFCLFLCIPSFSSLFLIFPSLFAFFLSFVGLLSFLCEPKPADKNKFHLFLAFAFSPYLSLFSFFSSFLTPTP